MKPGDIKIIDRVSAVEAIKHLNEEKRSRANWICRGCRWFDKTMDLAVFTKSSRQITIAIASFQATLKAI